MISNFQSLKEISVAKASLHLLATVSLVPGLMVVVLKVDRVGPVMAVMPLMTSF